jgi:hypothetical protein
MPGTITQIRGSQPIRKDWTYETTPAGCAPFLREKFAALEVFAGDMFELEGEFDFGKSEEGSLVLPSGSRDKPAVVKSGATPAVLRSAIYSDANGSAFVGWHTELRGLSLIEQTWKTDEDGRCLGVDLKTKSGIVLRTVPDAASGPVLRVIDCHLGATAWCGYFWESCPVGLIAERTIFDSARVALALCASGAGNLQTSSLRECTFLVDVGRWNDIGATSGPDWGGGFGAICRNGSHVFDHCTMQLRWRRPNNPAYPAPRLVGIADATAELGKPLGEALPDPNTKISVKDCTFLADPGETDRRLCADVELRHPNVRKNLALTGMNVGTGEFNSLRIGPFVDLPHAKEAAATQ